MEKLKVHKNKHEDESIKELQKIFSESIFNERLHQVFRDEIKKREGIGEETVVTEMNGLGKERTEATKRRELDGLTVENDDKILGKAAFVSFIDESNEIIEKFLINNEALREIQQYYPRKDMQECMVRKIATHELAHYYAFTRNELIRDYRKTRDIDLDSDISGYHEQSFSIRTDKDGSNMDKIVMSAGRPFNEGMTELVARMILREFYRREGMPDVLTEVLEREDEVGYEYNQYIDGIFSFIDFISKHENIDSQQLTMSLLEGYVNSPRETWESIVDLCEKHDAMRWLDAMIEVTETRSSS